MPATILYLTSDDYARRTGGYVYNSRLVEALRQQAIDVETLSFRTAFPRVPEVDRRKLADRLSSAPTGTVLVTDHIHLCDLLPTFWNATVPVVAIFHHSLAMENAVNETVGSHALKLSESAALEHATLILTTSQESRRYLEDECQIDPSRILVRVPGNPKPVRTPVAQAGRQVAELLSVGAVIARKRYDYLLQVAAAMADIPWRWRIVGDPMRDPQLFSALAGTAERLGLADRLVFLGDVPDEDLERLWQDADLLLAASHYEGYGMAVAEALRHGVPVVTTASGAVSGWATAGVEQAPADDAQAMAGLVRRLLTEPMRRKALADAAFAFGRTLPSWEETFAGVGAWMLGDFGQNQRLSA